MVSDCGSARQDVVGAKFSAMSVTDPVNYAARMLDFVERKMPKENMLRKRDSVIVR